MRNNLAVQQTLRPHGAIKLHFLIDFQYDIFSELPAVVFRAAATVMAEMIVCFQTRSCWQSARRSWQKQAEIR